MKWYVLKENDKYLINKNGEVKSLKTNKILKPGRTKNGYYTVALCKNGKQRTYYIHRLVANNFIENINGYKEINHKDGNKSNNIIDNLEWCDRKHNLKEAYRLGLKETPKGVNNVKSRKIIQYDLYTGNIKVWDSISDAKRENNYSTGSICDACKGNIKTYKSSHWEYV